MNRDQILKYLNYKGKYTKDVKKKLNKLLKKYHPDNNKDDKTTILIIYQIKKELEEGTLTSNYDNINNSSSKTDTSILFLENMIRRLKKKKEIIDKKIDKLYMKISHYYKLINNKQEEISFIETDIIEINDELKKLSRIDFIDIILIILIIVSIIIMIILKKYILFVPIIIFALSEKYYVDLKKKIFLKKRERLIKSDKIKEDITSDLNYVVDKVNSLVESEKKLKTERSNIKNDIQFYNHELSKVKDDGLSKENTYDNSKSFTKK